MPTISVLMCVYNREQFLPEAMESVLNQTFQDLEFVVVNDGSTDKSGLIIKKYVEKDSRVIYVENQHNMGIPASVYRGLQYCNGKYIARMDSDDICHPERLKIQYEFMESHPEIDVAGTGFDFIDSSGNRTGKFLVRPEDPMVTRLHMFYHCILHNPTTIMKSSFYKHFNEDNLEEEYLAAEDYHFWLRGNFEYIYTNMPERLLFYRLHDSNISVTEFTPQRESFIFAAHEAFEKLLAKKLSFEAIKTFYFSARYTTDNSKAVREALSVIYLTQKSFEAQNSLSSFQKSETRLFSYEKLKSVTMRYKHFRWILPLGSYYLFRLLPGKFLDDSYSKIKPKEK